MSSSETPTIICPNCGRKETRPDIRFCPNCGATLPGWTRAHPTASGFGALAQAELPAEPEERIENPRPILKPVQQYEEADSSEEPHQPWSPPLPPQPSLTGQRQRSSKTVWGVLGGCLAVLGIAGVVVATIFVLLFLGLLLICSGIHC